MESSVRPAEKGEPRRRIRKRAAPSPDAFAYTIQDAQSYGAPGKTKIYALAKTGKLKLIRKDGLPTMIEGDSLRALLLGEADE